ncbi:MAG: glycoside hydrolase family 31 protein [Acidobacteriia bacterium]|nr:glycoside hydrolase family 31 protein [Terriglobia bacterium]
MAGQGPRIGLVLALWFACTGSTAAQGWQHIGKVRHVDQLKDGVELTASAARVRITAVRDGVIRVRVAPDGTFAKDFSWAVIETPEPPPIKVENGEIELRMTAGSVVVLVKKAPLLIRFTDAAGNVLLEDEPSLPMAWNGKSVHVWKKMPLEESYYGLGDKAGPMNRRNRSFTMWNTDSFGWQESSDPLYKTIPFFMGLRHGRAYGVFFDNTYRSSFDFGKESGDHFSFGAEGGELNYYFFAGPEPKKVLQEYTAFVGRTPLPPLWALGYQQCRYSYYPEARVREVARMLREKKIPADAIYLDIDYQEGYAPFTINRSYFPTFEQMIKDLRAEGFHTIAITDLHIKKDPGHGYAPYDTGIKDDVFIKNPDGSVYVGTVWPDDSVFPDFTLSRVRDWWGGLYKEFVGIGVAGFWNDMNEPAIFKYPEKTMPPGVVHRLDDGTTLDHRAIHNVMGMQNARATYEGLRKLRPEQRPFVLTRAAYAGAQRYAATWTGDNSSTWNHLAMSTPMLLSMGISGYPLVGDDIGGFAGSPPADLLTRWFEAGAFNPIYRDHTLKGTADQEPWVHGPEHEAIRRKYIELRYKLLPYIYTSTKEMVDTGIPLMRPLFLEFPEAETLYGNDQEFLFGPSLLVSPRVTEMMGGYEVRLPPGIWYDYWTGTQTPGGKTLFVDPPLDVVPLYVRGGSIVPQQPVVQYTGEKPDGPLTLRVYPGEPCHGSLYGDDGESYNFTRGEFIRLEFTCQPASGSVTFTLSSRKGGYKPWWSEVSLEIYGVSRSPKEVRVGDRAVSNWKFDEAQQCVTLALPDPSEGTQVRVIY